MSSKYKSPLIRSRNTSLTFDNTSVNAESPSKQANNSATDNKLGNFIVFDNTPQESPVSLNRRGRGCSSPRFNSPRPPRQSPYQWTSPNRFNNSWSSDQNTSGSPMLHERNSHSSYRPQFNKYNKHNTNNYSSWNNSNSGENFFHPSMLEDPWALLLNNSINERG